MLNINGYQILTQIYESTKSNVYRGLRQQDNQPVILKFLKEDYPAPAELTRYKQEYEITRNLNIEGAIKAYELKPYQRALVIILEDCGAVSLKQLMNEGRVASTGTLPLEEFLNIAIKTAEILSDIHAASIIHKDINPANIIFSPETKQLKIIDFGIATQFSRENPTLKNPNVLEGTLAYMSPEQTGRMNRSLDYRTDFYSFGVTCYELLTGKLPFDTNDPLELVHCQIAKVPISPHQLNPEIPKAVSDIVMKMMAKTAEDRYQSAFGIKNDLAECLHQLQTAGNISDFPLGTKDIAEQFQIPQKLYGREAEIQALLAAFDRAANPLSSPLSKGSQCVAGTSPVVATGAGQRGVQMMLVAGYSGIGKSALIKELYKPITRSRGYFISGKFDQFQRNIPYSAVVSAFQELVRQLLTETETQLQLWREKLLTALGTNGQLIIDVIPEVELIVGKQTQVPELGGTEAQNRFNLVFGNFIRAFCSTEHPLVVFLDDLQWADAATLKLIELMMADSDTQYLFLIGAYRDNEVSPTHPLMVTLEEIQKTSLSKSVLQNLENEQPTLTKIHQINLTPLGIEDISQLLADTLHSNKATVKPLAEMVMAKTRGNPFFVNEFLKTLYAEGLLKFQHPQSAPISGCDTEEIRGFWQWNLSEIEALGITDNVVELTIANLKKLPEAAQNILQLAACIGANFDLHTLAVICEKTPKQVFDELREALKSGLILSLSELDEQLLIQKYRFLHDRIQQAAYSLIPEEAKQLTHLKVGRLLLNNTPPNEREEKVFEIVNQLNAGKDLIALPEERELAVELNLVAGRKAIASTAYKAAMVYLNVAINLSGTSGWHSQYNLTLEIYNAASEAAYLSGNFDRMQELITIVLSQSQNNLDRVKVYQTKIRAEKSQNKMLEAWQTGLEVMGLLGVNLPNEISQSELAQILSEARIKLIDRTHEELVNLPQMSDIQALAEINLLAILIPVALQSKPEFLPAVVVKMLNLSLDFGNTEVSSFAYSLYGLILCSALDLEFGYRLGEIAISVMEKLQSKATKCKVFHVVYSFIRPWQQHLKKSIKYAKQASQIGLENGDLEFAGYTALTQCQYAYLTGSKLLEIQPTLANYINAFTQLKQFTSVYYMQTYFYPICYLLELNPTEIDRSWVELELTLKKSNDFYGLFHLYANKLLISYWLEDFNSAIDRANLAEPCIAATPSHSIIPVFYFYDSLARLAVFNQQQIPEVLEKVKSNQAKMQIWAERAPMNCLHKFDLVEAETARVLGDYLKAIEYYDRAIAGAKENEYINEEALANELAARFYLNWGKEQLARHYIQEAHYAYTCWGATAKVKMFEQKYRQLLTLTPATPGINRMTTTHTSTGTNSAITLDLATVMKASQAISGEIVLEKLLISLMEFIIQNAGAEKGYLILETDNRLLIEASGVVGEDRITALQSLPIADRLPVSLINYVARLKEDLVLTDAVRQGNFVSDPYIRLHQTKSILCTPLVNQGKLIGVVYLENNLTTEAFTPQRLEVIKLLSGQAVISLENARLYQTLEAKVEERTAQLAEANQKISALNKKLKAENLRMSAELDIVKQLQQMVLPKQSDLEAVEGLEIAGFMEPADEVGGDYYDVLQQDDRVKISIGDVTGHGLESGVLMIMAQTAVRTLHKMNETDPVKFLDVLNQTLYDNLQRIESDRNMTLAVLDYAGGALKLSGQHEEAIVVRADGTLECIDTMDLGFPIGLVDEIGDFIAQTEVLLNPGDVVVLYTDGIPEARDINKAQYGLERLRQIVVENRLRSALEIREAVIDDVRQYIGTQKVFDDITLVVMKQQ